MTPITVSLPDTKFNKNSFCPSRIIVRGDTNREGEARHCISATFHREHAQRQFLTKIKLYLAAACLTQQVRHNSLPSEGC